MSFLLSNAQDALTKRIMQNLVRKCPSCKTGYVPLGPAEFTCSNPLCMAAAIEKVAAAPKTRQVIPKEAK